jgi:hypothetical protein
LRRARGSTACGKIRHLDLRGRRGGTESNSVP